MTADRFVFDFDFDELDAMGLPHCPITYLFPEPPTVFMLEVVGPFLRLRDRGRRILVEGVIRNLALANDHMTAQLQFDGGERPRLLGAVVTGEVDQPAWWKRYCYGEPYDLPGEAVVTLRNGQEIIAQSIRAWPIRETSEGEGS